MEDDYILASFLHPKFKQLIAATAAQKAECYRACRVSMPKTTGMTTTDDENEPIRKKPKKFLEQLMDSEIKKTKCTETARDEVDLYIDFKIIEEKDYDNPLSFWKEHENIFPHLASIARRIFSIPCSSAAVERQFSAAGQLINQRRSNLDPTTLNNILFLRSIEKNKRND
ncbi:unnamed protein product [Rotaria sp. Silwood2]|nr:unnamed protein product [Rotaria sp. Silwood2]CAF3359954.1 unnamed protein product [Rotaria sp. Silwood2]CAF4566057.1 unnamed protein product [Rotaria sp. Silwood2]CAF4676515.1 unnamed protein product [Rotaria sp. Silwood2]